MSLHRCMKGTSLIELLIVLSIFSVIIAAVYSLYITLLKHVSVQRKMVKTDFDLMTSGWPLVKEIQTAGLGIPGSGACNPPVVYTDGVLTIHSTASGNGKYAGAWSYISDYCMVSHMPDGEHVSVIHTVTKDLLGLGIVNAGRVSPCTSSYYDHVSAIAYWIPAPETGCYETRYALRKYATGTKPRMCAPSTWKFSRSVSKTPGITRYQPLIDCVFGRDPQGDKGVQFLFGCIDSSGNLTWRRNAECGTSPLRFIRVGMLVQSSPKRELQGQDTFIFFEDCDPSLRVTLHLNEEERYYRWTTWEHTIPLRNLG